MNKEEALSNIQQVAEHILQESQEPVVRVRLLRDIFHRPDDDLELTESRELAADTKLGKRLEEEIKSGAYMRALGTAIKIGVSEEHPVFAAAKNHAESYLTEGVLNVSKRLDKSITGIDLSVFERRLASVLARVDRKSFLVEEIFEKWATIAGVAFSSGIYNREEQIHATKAIFSPEYGLRHAFHYPDDVLADASALLSARIDLLDPEVDEAYSRWYVLEKRNIDKNFDRLFSPSTRPSHKTLYASSILLDMGALYGFRNWSKYMKGIVENLWKIRGNDGLWNFGAACADPNYLSQIRLSDNWRGKRGAHDWTTRILLLLQKYYESEK